MHASYSVILPPYPATASRRPLGERRTEKTALSCSHAASSALVSASYSSARPRPCTSEPIARRAESADRWTERTVVAAPPAPAEPPHAARAASAASPVALDLK